MKHILIIGLAFLLCACQKDLDTWSGRSFVYFDGTTDSTFFSYAYVDGKIPSDSLWVWIRVSGEVTDYDRDIKLKIAETNGEAGVDFAAVPESFTLEKGRTFVAALVELLRPASLKTEEKYLVLELQENDDFKLLWLSQPLATHSERRYSKIRYKIVFSEIVNTPPKGWSDTYFGVFSVKKLDYMCQKLNMTRLMFNDVSYVNKRREYIATKMVKLLNAEPLYEDDGVTLMRMGDMYYN